MKCAILGYGTVGGGTAELLMEQAEKIAVCAGEPVELKYILARREYPQDLFTDRMVRDFAVIESDPEVGMVAEAIGGVGAAYDYTLRALRAGKSVVTSNKELVATHGAELLALAQEKKVSYLFEGSVGGGTPLIAPISHCFAASRVDEVCGILNGTTNYILTAMQTSGKSFEETLKKAQALGYAEADPTADVAGIDAGRKTAILAGLCFGQTIAPADIATSGITDVTAADLKLAEATGYTIKLLGRAMRTEKGICVLVAPHLVPKGHILASVSGVMNACLVKASAVGEVLFYGPGAGRRQTGSAMVSDIVQAVRTAGAPLNPSLGVSGPKPVAADELSSAWYVRTTAKPGTPPANFAGAKLIYSADGQSAYLTQAMDKKALEPHLEKIRALSAFRVLAAEEISC